MKIDNRSKSKVNKLVIFGWFHHVRRHHILYLLSVCPAQQGHCCTFLHSGKKFTGWALANWMLEGALQRNTQRSCACKKRVKNTLDMPWVFEWRLKVSSSCTQIVACQALGHWGRSKEAAAMESARRTGHGKEKGEGARRLHRTWRTFSHLVEETCIIRETFMVCYEQTAN